MGCWASTGAACAEYGCRWLRSASGAQCKVKFCAVQHVLVPEQRCLRCAALNIPARRRCSCWRRKLQFIGIGYRCSLRAIAAREIRLADLPFFKCRERRGAAQGGFAATPRTTSENRPALPSTCTISFQPPRFDADQRTALRRHKPMAARWAHNLANIQAVADRASESSAAARSGDLRLRCHQGQYHPNGVWRQPAPAQALFSATSSIVDDGGALRRLQRPIPAATTDQPLNRSHLTSRGFMDMGRQQRRLPTKTKRLPRRHLLRHRRPVQRNVAPARRRWLSLPNNY